MEVPKEWADKHAGKFDDGWDAYREKPFARQKELGIVPADREPLPPRPRRAGVDSLSEPERKLSSRMMEVSQVFWSTPTTTWAVCWTSCEPRVSSTTRS